MNTNDEESLMNDSRWLLNYLASLQSKKQRQDHDEADQFAMYVEELASTYEVTCDYIIQEFILD